MRIDLRKQLKTYGESFLAFSKNKAYAAYGIFYQRTEKSPEEETVQITPRGKVHNKKYNLWFALEPNYEKYQGKIYKVKAHQKEYETISGSYDRNLCCWRLIVQEVEK